MKKGDFVTGIDKSYQRSIYEVVELTEYCGVQAIGLIFRQLDNFISPLNDISEYCVRPLKDFRIATDIEVGFSGLFVEEKYSSYLSLSELKRVIYENEFQKYLLMKSVLMTIK